MIAAIASTAALVGCNSMEQAAGKFVLGEKFVTANDQLNRCDLSGVGYLKSELNNESQMMASAATLALGAHYAAIGDQHGINAMAKNLAKHSDGKVSLSKAKSEILDAGRETARDRVNNGFKANCK